MMQLTIMEVVEFMAAVEMIRLTEVMATMSLMVVRATI